jgi:hypothetical protein
VATQAAAEATANGRHFSAAANIAAANSARLHVKRIAAGR